MKVINKPYYKCDFCGKIYHRKHACTKHEDLCKKNPANYRPCFDCLELIQKEIKVLITKSTNIDYGEICYRNVFYCKKREIFMHTPINHKKENEYDLIDFENNEMFIICSYFDTVNFCD